MFHANANTMFARAIRAIEALQQGQDRHGTTLPVYLHAWDSGVRQTDEIQTSIEQVTRQANCCIVVAVNSSLLLSDHTTGQLPAWVLELQQLALGDAGVESFTVLSGPDNQELRAIQRACSDLQQAIATHCLVLGCGSLLQAAQTEQATNSEQILLSSLLLSTRHQRFMDKQQPLQLKVTGLSALLQTSAGTAAKELLASQLPAETKSVPEVNSSWQPIKLACQVDQPPILAAITLLAQWAVAAEAEPLAQLLGVDRLPQQHQHAEGWMLTIGHSESIAGLRSQMAVDSNCNFQIEPLSIAAPDFSATASDQSINQRLLGMLAQVTGYTVAQLTAAEMAGKALALDSIMAMELASLFQQSFAKPLLAATLLERPSVEQILLKLTEQLDSQEPVSIFRPQDHAAQTAGGGPYSASQAQTAMYYQSRIMPGHIGHLLRYPVRVGADIDTAVLQQALNALALRHPMLSAQFGATADQVQILFNAEPGITLHIDTLDDLGAAAIQQWIEQCSTKPMVLSHDPLCRFHLSVDRHAASGVQNVLLLVAHHIIADYVSLEIIWRDLEQLYAGYLKDAPVMLPEIDFSHADLVKISCWQANSPEAHQQRSYWRAQLQQPPASLKLGIELEGARQSCAGFEFQTALDQRLSNSISQLATQLKVTDFLIMFSVYAVLLLQQSKSESLSVGVTTDGRSGHPNRDLVGCFVNTVPVMVAAEWLQWSLSDLVRQHAGFIRQAISSDRVPFMELVKLAPINREPVRPLLFQTLFSWLSGSKAVADNTLQRRPYQPVSESLSQVGVTHDLVLAIHARSEHRVCNWAFDAGVYAGADIIQLSQAYESLLERLLANPREPLGNLLNEASSSSTDQQRRERLVM